MPYSPTPSAASEPDSYSAFGRRGCGRGRHQWYELAYSPSNRFVKACRNCTAKVIVSDVDGREEVYFVPTVSETVAMLRIAAIGGAPYSDPATGKVLSRYEAQKVLDEYRTWEREKAEGTRGKPEYIDDYKLTEVYPTPETMMEKAKREYDATEKPWIALPMMINGTGIFDTSAIISASATLDSSAIISANVPRNARPPQQTTLRRITSMEAMQFILDEITNAEDPFAAAGVWLTRFTNGVAEITREEE